MKNRILLLLLLISSCCFGQSVPNTTTFSLQNVYDVVHSHASGTTTNLQSCFDNAVAGYFDPTYNQVSYAPANSMLRFRNYTVSNPCISPPAYNYGLYWSMTTDNCGTYDINPSFSAACTAINIWRDWMYNNNSLGCQDFIYVGPGFSGYQYKSIVPPTVGVQLYEETGAGTGVWCPSGDGGYYVNDSKNVVYLISGVIQSITTCP